jgi:hypothetical protein
MTAAERGTVLELQLLKHLPSWTFLWLSTVLESNSDIVRPFRGLGFRIGFLAGHDVWGDI